MFLYADLPEETQRKVVEYFKNWTLPEDWRAKVFEDIEANMTPLGIRNITWIANAPYLLSCNVVGDDFKPWLEDQGLLHLLAVGRMDDDLDLCARGMRFSRGQAQVHYWLPKELSDDKEKWWAETEKLVVTRFEAQCNQYIKEAKACLQRSYECLTHRERIAQAFMEQKILFSLEGKMLGPKKEEL